ncbi:MAG: 4Fe-4S cluster-binding domain-containing protein [Planctomycetota bacterium]
MREPAPIRRIFDLRRYSIHDGPGIRTTVFLQGCPLSCWWCHNPEGRAVEPFVHYEPGRCLGCGACIEQCVAQALSRGPDRIRTDLARCRRCGECGAACACGTSRTRPSTRATLHTAPPSHGLA